MKRKEKVESSKKRGQMKLSSQNLFQPLKLISIAFVPLFGVITPPLSLGNPPPQLSAHEAWQG